MWSLGGMIGPFITARFLVDLPHTGDGGVSSSDALDFTNGTGGNNNCTSFNLGNSVSGFGSYKGGVSFE